MAVRNREEFARATGAAAVIAGLLFWFGGRGLTAYFSSDDMLNLWSYWSKSWGAVLGGNVQYWSPFYRPAGGLFYLGLFEVFGFHPLPFRIVCYAVLGANLALLYAVAARLSGSREVGALAALLAAYHASFSDLYFNSGTIYDLLAFFFYAGAFLFYVNRRWRLLVVAGYVCALNSKEIAVTLPAALLFYELVYHPPEWSGGGVGWWLTRQTWFVWLLAAMTVPYLAGKLSAESAFHGVEPYQPHISVQVYLDTYRYYLDRMFYTPVGWFTTGREVALWAGMLCVAAVSRGRHLWFAALFVLVSVLPVIFITPRGTMFVRCCFSTIRFPRTNTRRCF